MLRSDKHNNSQADVRFTSKQGITIKSQQIGDKNTVEGGTVEELSQLEKNKSNIKYEDDKRRQEELSKNVKAMSHESAAMDIANEVIKLADKE